MYYKVPDQETYFKVMTILTNRGFKWVMTERGDTKEVAPFGGPWYIPKGHLIYADEKTKTLGFIDEREVREIDEL